MILAVHPSACQKYAGMRIDRGAIFVCCTALQWPTRGFDRPDDDFPSGVECWRKKSHGAPQTPDIGKPECTQSSIVSC
jgi:hypothetical protein